MKSPSRVPPIPTLETDALILNHGAYGSGQESDFTAAATEAARKVGHGNGGPAANQ